MGSVKAWDYIGFGRNHGERNNGSDTCSDSVGEQLIGVSIFEERLENRLKIKEQIPMLYVIKIMNDPFSQIGITPKTVHLRPSCDPRFYRMASVVMRDLVLKAPDQFRAFGPRPNEAHLALEHIPELRYLVDIPLPHKRTDSKPACVVFSGPADFPVLLRVQPHTANLQHVESLSIPAEPSLAI
jgi:hypothetical protein